MELKNRKEMDPQFQWDISHIFADKAAWETALAEMDGELEKIKAVKGTLGKSAKAMREGLDAVYEANRKAVLVYEYAFLSKSGDSSDPENQELEARSMNMLVGFSSALAFLEPEILAIPEKKLEKFLKSKELAGYIHIINDITRTRAHILDEERERMIAMLGDIFGGPSDTFDMLTDVDFVYPEVTLPDGTSMRITNGSLGMLREHTDRSVREAAFEGYFGKYRDFINTISANYATSVKKDNWVAQIRGYGSACEKALDANNVPVSVYDSLIEAAHDSLGSMKKYIELRKKALGLEKIDCFDLYTPMLPSVDYPMPYEEGKKLVREALAPLGEDYQKLLDKAYSEGWIDVYENKGKRSGAFSSGVYGVHPYVMLNYTDTLDDAFTLAHELGHAMHSYKSSETQDFANHDYSIMVAEVASTVNEVLLTMHLLKTETEPSRRAYVLNHFLESFRTTFFRQVQFAEFERKAHDLCQQGTPLTAQTLCGVYKELLELYYNGAEINEVMANEWAFVSHFYRAYYVYQYATGFSSAVAIARNIIETGDASGYLKFLTLGGSDYPIEELKVAGIDLTKPETVLNAMKVFDETIDQLDELLSQQA